MAFSQTTLIDAIIGNKRLVGGAFNGDSVTTGDVDTGLHSCEMFVVIPGGATVHTNAPVVTETLPHAGSAITITFDSGATGYWLAIGDF